MPKKKPAAPPAECPKCLGYGLIVDREGHTTRCDCGQWENITLGDRLHRARIPARYARRSLKTFEAGRGDLCRREIILAATSYAGSFSPAEERGLLLRGGTGAGKTHIAIGILIEVVRRGYTGLYCNVTDLLARLRESYGDDAEKTEAAILAEMDEVELLVLDDLGAESTSDWVRDRLYLVINRRYENARATIITTNCMDSAELRERVGPRIASRIVEMCDPFHPFPEEDYRYRAMQ